MNHKCLNCQKDYQSPHHFDLWCSSKCETEFIENGKRQLMKHLSDLFGLFDHRAVLQRQVEKGATFDLIKKKSREETYWKFSRAMFWPHQEFHEGEVNKYKRQISELFKDSRNIDETFTEFVERACLAKRHIEDKEDRFIPQPEAWFDLNNPFGISTTQKWYGALQRQRQYNPSFNQGFKLFAQAVMSYADTRNILDITHYRKLFIELTHYDILQWYINVVMHLQFIEI